MSAWATVFWWTLGFVVYTYVGYPVIVWVLARLLPAATGEAPPAPPEWPAVSVIIAVHNERDRALMKVANLREFDYPADRLQIIFACDGCTDGTDLALASLPGITVVDCQPRAGKPSALNRAVPLATSPVLLFADVRQRIDPAALKVLVARLLQTGIGAVTGELAHYDPTTHTAQHLGLYWRYENWIRLSEGGFASTVGVAGALYVIRRSDYTPLPADTVLDDFVQAMFIVRKRLRVVYDRQAVVLDELQKDASGERKRKVRTLTGNFQAFVRYPWLFSPRQNRIAFQFVSHKVCRLLVPYALTMLLCASVLCAGWVYGLALAVQLAFYAAALGGNRSTRLRAHKFVSFATLFVEMNWAAVLGLRNYLRGAVDARWERT